MPDREVFRRTAFSAAISTSNLLPDAVMQYALSDLLDINVDMGRLQRRRDRMLEVLRAAGYQVNTPEATFYLLVRAPIEDEMTFVRRLAQDKVFVLSGLSFEMPGYFRISLTATDEMVDRALPIFERAIRQNA